MNENNRTLTWEVALPILERMTLQKQKITQRNLIKEAGVGSEGTAKKHIDRYKDQLHPVNKLAGIMTDIPEHVLNTVYVMWNAIRVEANDQFSEQVQKYKEKEEKDAQTISALQAEVQSFEETLSDLQLANAKLVNDVDELEERNSNLKEEALSIANERNRFQNLLVSTEEKYESRLAKQRSEHEANLSKLTAEYSRRENSLMLDVESAGAQVAAVNDQVRYERERSDDETRRLYQLMDNERNNHAEAIQLKEEKISNMQQEIDSQSDIIDDLRRKLR